MERTGSEEMGRVMPKWRSKVPVPGPSKAVRLEYMLSVYEKINILNEI